MKYETYKTLAICKVLPLIEEAQKILFDRVVEVDECQPVVHGAEDVRKHLDLLIEANKRCKETCTPHGEDHCHLWPYLRELRIRQAQWRSALDESIDYSDSNVCSAQEYEIRHYECLIHAGRTGILTLNMENLTI